MKNLSTFRASFSVGLLALSGLLLPVQLWAQSPSPAPSTSASASPPADAGEGQAGAGGAQRRNLLSQLTPEERQKLKAAHDAALRDPAVTAVSAERTTNRPAFQRAVREAMLRADPSVGPILEKLRSMEHQTQAQLRQTRLSGLSPEEQTRVRAARQKAHNDPAVISAREAVRTATTPEAKQQARQALAVALHQAVLKIDPSLAPILAKLRQSSGGGEISDF